MKLREYIPELCATIQMKKKAIIMSPLENSDDLCI